MKTFHLTFLFIALTLQNVSAQINDYSNCKYEYADVTILLNGWDASRLDYDYNNFRNTVTLPSGTIYTSPDPNVTAEFGYPWFSYEYGVNTIVFAGVIEQNQGYNNPSYNNKNQLFSFVLKDNAFNVNGISVGQPTTSISTQFPNICHDISKSAFLFLYGPVHSLTFYYDQQTNLITEIRYNTLL